MQSSEQLDVVLFQALTLAWLHKILFGSLFHSRHYFGYSIISSILRKILHPWTISFRNEAVVKGH